MPTTLLYMDMVSVLVEQRFWFSSYFYGDSENKYVCRMNDYPCMERPIQMSTIKTLEHCSSYYCWLWKGICTQGSTAF